MEKQSFKKSILLILGFIGLTRLTAQEIPALKPILTNTSNTESVGNFITITKIKKPWIAPRKLVIKKFIESIPQYAQIKGLQTKYYAFSENTEYFGGIYLWNTEIAARNWFNNQWFERVIKTYKNEGEVIYYSVTGIETIQNIYKTKGNYYTVLSLGNPALKTPAKELEGLLRIIYITDSKGVAGHISLWQSETKARAFFSTDLSANEFFDTPILLNNQ